MTVSDRPIRVIQWATGAVGTETPPARRDARPAARKAPAHCEQT